MAKKRQRASKVGSRRKRSNSKCKVSRRRVSRRSSSGVSRKSLAVMLVLVIAVSVLGTWVMLNTGSSMKNASSSTQGKISFKVMNHGEIAKVYTNGGPRSGEVSFRYLG